MSDLDAQVDIENINFYCHLISRAFYFTGLVYTP